MKFGVREICDVTFKATAANQRVGKLTFAKYQPVFKIDTATTSEMTQESTTVYAQGGKGYNRLIAWEGEKTMTFTVTDALMSPMGLAVLSGAGLMNADKDNLIHVHTKYAGVVKGGKTTIKYDELAAELGINDGSAIKICTDVDIFGNILDGSGAGIDWLAPSTIEDDDTKLATLEKDGELEVTLGEPMLKDLETYEGWAVELDFYVVMASGATEIIIEPGSFGGYFYVEADTLFRREDDGQDMAAVLTFPRVKVQSGFTFTMAASGDPSTFDFTMDAFPGYTQFDRTKKVCVVMDIVGDDKTGAADTTHPTVDAETHDGAFA